MSSGREPIASPPGSGTTARRHRATSGPEHAHRRPQLRHRPVVGLGARLAPGRRWPPCRASTVDRAAQAAQHVGHQRDVEDLRAVGDRRRALGEQRRRHELEHAVLGADHVDRARRAGRRRVTAKCSTTADDASAWHLLVSGTVGRYRPDTVGMAVHLTRIYTKTGDDGTTALGDFTRVRKTDVRLAAYADTDECNAAIGVAVHRRRPGRGRARPAAPGAERPVRRGRGPVQPRSSQDPKYPPLRVTEDYVDPARGLVRRVQRGPAEARLVHPARRHPGRGATCTWRARSPAAPSGRCGRCSTPTPSAPTR